MAIDILDFLAIPHLFGVTAPTPTASSAGFFPVDWTGIPGGVPGPVIQRRANAQVAFDVRDAYQVVLRQMQQERELVRTRRLLRLQQIVTRSNIQRAAIEYENKLKSASAAYAVLLAEL